MCPRGRGNSPWFASSAYATGENRENLRKNKMRTVRVQFQHFKAGRGRRRAESPKWVQGKALVEDQRKSSLEAFVFVRFLIQRASIFLGFRDHVIRIKNLQKIQNFQKATPTGH